MDKYDFPQVIERLTGLAEVYNVKPVSDAGTKAWWFALRTFQTSAVLGALDSWANTKSKMPTPADIVGMANSRTSSVEADPAASYAYWLGYADRPEERAAREQRLIALWQKFGVPIDMARPLREQLLIKAMYCKRPMWAAVRVPGEDDE